MAVEGPRCGRVVSAQGAAKGQVSGLDLPVKRRKEKAAEWDQVGESPPAHRAKSHSR